MGPYDIHAFHSIAVARMPHHAHMKRSVPQESVSSQGVPERSTQQRRAPGRPPRAQADAPRQNILDASLQVFIARGFAAASMEGIAREAGVARLTLYRHFQTKEQLFVEVARRAQLRLRDRIGVLEDRGLPLEPVLREIIQKLYEAYTHPEYLAVLRMVIAESVRFPRLGRAMLDDYTHVSLPLVAYLQQLKDRGQIAIESPHDAAMQIAGLACGAGRYVLISPPRSLAGRRHAVESLVLLFTRAWRIDPP